MLPPDRMVSPLLVLFEESAECRSTFLNHTSLILFALRLFKLAPRHPSRPPRLSFGTFCRAQLLRTLHQILSTSNVRNTRGSTGAKSPGLTPPESRPGSHAHLAPSCRRPTQPAVPGPKSLRPWLVIVAHAGSLVVQSGAPPGYQLPVHQQPLPLANIRVQPLALLINTYSVDFDHGCGAIHF